MKTGLCSGARGRVERSRGTWWHPLASAAWGASLASRVDTVIFHCVPHVSSLKTLSSNQDFCLPSVSDWLCFHHFCLGVFGAVFWDVAGALTSGPQVFFTVCLLLLSPSFESVLLIKPFIFMISIKY